MDSVEVLGCGNEEGGAGKSVVGWGGGYVVHGFFFSLFVEEHDLM